MNALRNLLFCIPKAAVLHGKSVGFALQKSRFRNVKAQLSLFKRIIFTKSRLFPIVTIAIGLVVVYNAYGLQIAVNNDGTNVFKPTFFQVFSYLVAQCVAGAEAFLVRGIDHCLAF